MPRTFLIDTDTASDDAVALIMALRRPDVRVEAVTVVSGNVPLEQAVRNALFTAADMCGSDVPVYPGAARPLLREPAHAEWFHGADGMGDRNYPPPSRQPDKRHAVDAMIDCIRAHPGIELVTLGPLTNVAMALLRAPDIASSVARCVIMGGNPCTVGNVTPAAEYNIWCDPEAARIVFRSGLPIEMVGWHLCRRDANLLPDEIEKVRGFGNPLADFVIDCNETAMEANRRQSGDVGISLPDPVAMAVALDPTIATRRSRHYVDIETRSELTRGMTVVDGLDVAGDERNRDVWREAIAGRPNADIVWEIDVPRWKEALYNAVRD